MKKSNLIACVMFLALAIFGYITTLGIVPRIENSDLIGPVAWPKALCVILALLSLLDILLTIFKKETDPPQEEGQEKIFDIHAVGFRRVLGMIALIVLFGALIHLFGIYIGIAVMMPVCMLLHGERSPLPLICITAGMALFVYLTFGLLLKVPLPTGIIFR